MLKIDPGYHLPLIGLFLVVLVLAVYLQTANHDFISYDDPAYVTANPHVSSGLSGANVRWAFTSIEEYNWHPLTWISHMTDVELFGLEPRGHHLVNVAFHLLSTLLLLLFLVRVTGSLWKSSFVSALFALHPLHVESVAWVAERKDVLSTFFWFLTLILYARYAEKRRPALYVCALLSFVLGLMTKPMLVTLPLVMLLLDYWPLHRAAGPAFLVKEKIPFFACSLLSGIVTIVAQHRGGATRSLEELPFLLRVENGLVAYLKYIWKTVWPADLAVLYPIPSSIPPGEVIAGLVLLLLVSVAAVRFGGRFPYLPVGWFWFLITLLPVIGLLQVGSQAMADRYMYVPMTGLLILAAWGVPDLAAGLKTRVAVLAAVSSVAIALSALLTWRQLGHWQDSISLYRHTVGVTAGNYLIHDNLGIDLVEMGELDAGIRELREALRIKPEHANSHFNLGIALDRKGDLDGAAQAYREALRLRPNLGKVRNNLGIVLARKGDVDGAIAVFGEAVRLDPADMKARENLEIALGQKGIRIGRSR